jgi:hypothetical protein
MGRAGFPKWDAGRWGEYVGLRNDGGAGWAPSLGRSATYAFGCGLGCQFRWIGYERSAHTCHGQIDRAEGLHTPMILTRVPRSPLSALVVLITTARLQ